MAGDELVLLVLDQGSRPVKVATVPFIMGRATDCQLQLPLNGVSRQHARIERNSAGSWTIADMGSKNGTFVNARAIEGIEVLREGDEVQLGNAMLRVQFGSRPSAVAAHTTESVPVPASSPLLVTAESASAAPSADSLVVVRGVEKLKDQWMGAAAAQAGSAGAQAVSRLKDLVEIAKALSTANSIEAIFDAVRDAVFRDLKGIERMALLIDRAGTGQLEMIQAADIALTGKAKLISEQNWISHSICRKVFDEKIAVKTGDAMSDSRFEGKVSIVLKGIRSAMAVPVWGETGVIGVLYADARMTIRDWHQAAEDDLSFFSTLGNLVAYSVQRWLLQERLKTEEALRGRLQRYHSPSVVQQLMAEGAFSEGRLVPQDREISIMFADIVGFTSMSERMTPTQIATLLNAFFDEMLDEVFRVGGTLDKFIGDCIMAFFGAPEEQRNHAARAVAAAVGMLKRLNQMNAAKRLPEPITLRIAINTGRAVVGDVGSAQRVDYTVLGPTINAAARMESICPPGGLVISEATFAAIGNTGPFTEMGEHKFKGIERPIKVYSLNLDSLK